MYAIPPVMTTSSAAATPKPRPTSVELDVAAFAASSAASFAPRRATSRIRARADSRDAVSRASTDARAIRGVARRDARIRVRGRRAATSRDVATATRAMDARGMASSDDDAASAHRDARARDASAPRGDGAMPRARADATRDARRRARDAGRATTPTARNPRRRARRRASAPKRRASAERVAETGAKNAYFARVDATALAEEEARDDDDAKTTRRRRDEDDATGDAATLPPVFAAVTRATVTAMTTAKARRRASDPAGAVRRIFDERRARRAAATIRTTTTTNAGRRTSEPTPARARFARALDGALDDALDDADASGGASARDGDDDASDGAYGLLLRAARDERAARDASLPEEYSLQEVRDGGAACEDLVALSVAFEREDARVGSLAGGLGGAVAHVLRTASGEAVGYTLTYENRAPEWDRARAVVLPPRLAHVFIRRDHRMRGLGTGLVNWWRRRFALRCAFFAVDSPNDSMTRTLLRVECAPATTRSGHGASSVHYIAPVAASS